MNSTLPTELNSILVNETELLAFEETTLLKDFCPKKIKALVPELSVVIDNLITLVPQKKYITVDVMKHNFINRGKTCVDPSFHVDGVGNNYALWCIGSFRTEFLMEAISIPGLGELNPKDLSPIIKSLTSIDKLKIEEVKSSVPMLYDSGCIHRGRIADAGNKRIMVRICSSDYIRPKNINLRKIG